VPFELVVTREAPQGLLRAHVARANPLARQDGAAVMVLFQGASGYVSPRLYDLAASGGRAVPTWNYAVVHAHGCLRIVDDAHWTLAHMRRATAQRKAAAHLPGPAWTVDDAPPDYVERLVAATVGIEIAIGRLDAKFKLSQNRSQAERVREATGAATD
jgi:transcriptional regulator